VASLGCFRYRGGLDRLSDSPSAQVEAR